MFAPLFADDFGAIISIIVLVVSFLGWLFNQIAGKNQPQQPPRPKPKRAEARDDIFIADEPPQRRPQKPQQKKQKQPQKTAETKAGRKPGGEIANRQFQTSDLGAGVRSHVTEIQTHKIDQSVQQHMASRVGQSVTEHLGAFTAATAATGSQQAASRTATQIVQILRNPASVRQAMIINTILTRPNHRRP